MTKDKELKYKNDLYLKQIRTNIWVVLSYLLLLFVWQYTLSFQSSMYVLMNSSILVMFIFGTLGLFICKEERDNIIKYTKSQIYYYLIVAFLYDMFFKTVLNSIVVSASLGNVDASLLVARQFILTFSTIIKIGFPMAYVVWMLQKFGIFKAGFTKRKQIERLRDVRDVKKKKVEYKEENIDRI